MVARAKTRGHNVERNEFEEKKTICNEIFSEKQSLGEPTDAFIAKKRMLFLLLEVKHDEITQLDMFYCLLNIKIRDKILHSSFGTYDQLLNSAREVEHLIDVRSEKNLA